MQWRPESRYGITVAHIRRRRGRTIADRRSTFSRTSERWTDPCMNCADDRAKLHLVRPCTPPTRPAFLFLRAAARLPHECLMSQCRPSQSTGDAPRWSPPAIWRTRRPPHRPPPRTVTAPPTRPPRPPTPRRDHARFRAHGGAPRAQDEPPPHARPSDRRADTLVHSAAPVAAPRPCTLQHPCAGARPRRSARLSRVLSERLAERRGFASFKNSHALLLYSVSQTFCRVRGANTSGSDCTA